MTVIPPPPGRFGDASTNPPDQEPELRRFPWFLIVTLLLVAGWGYSAFLSWYLFLASSLFLGAIVGFLFVLRHRRRTPLRLLREGRLEEFHRWTDRAVAAAKTSRARDLLLYNQSSGYWLAGEYGRALAILEQQVQPGWWWTEEFAVLYDCGMLDTLIFYDRVRAKAYFERCRARLALSGRAGDLQLAIESTVRAYKLLIEGDDSGVGYFEQGAASSLPQRAALFSYYLAVIAHRRGDVEGRDRHLAAGERSCPWLRFPKVSDSLWEQPRRGPVGPGRGEASP